MRGIIKRVAGGIFHVINREQQWIVHSPGKIKMSQKLLVGDKVEFSEEQGDFIIDKVFPRKNEFYRPKAANVDIVIIVASMVEPQFDSYLTDKLLIHASQAGSEPLLLLTKTDLDHEKAKTITREYEFCGYKVFHTELGQNSYEEMTTLLQDKIVLLTGNSGVGKSTFLNQLASKEIQTTSAISQKLGRGRHTTRHGEIFYIHGFYLIDTPGFSSFEVKDLNEGEHLGDFFPEFHSFARSCKFNTCMHDQEPECGIKKAVAEGNILASRYASYKALLKEIKRKEEERW